MALIDVADALMAIWGYRRVPECDCRPESTCAERVAEYCQLTNLSDASECTTTAGCAVPNEDSASCLWRCQELLRATRELRGADDAAITEIDKEVTDER